MGQVFAKPKILGRIVDCIKEDNAVIVEIGAGDGRLTTKLLEKSKRIFAVEIDVRYCNLLKEIFRDNPKVSIIHEDILKFDIPNCDYVIGNSPFYISSSLIKKLTKIKFKHAILMFQKEFVDKLLSDNKEMTAISVIANNYFRINKLFRVSRDNFSPKPSVDASVISLEPIPEKDRLFSEEQINIIVSMFNNKKKSISWHLSNFIDGRDKIISILNQLGINPNERIYHIRRDRLKMLMEAII